MVNPLKKVADKVNEGVHTVVDQTGKGFQNAHVVTKSLTSKLPGLTSKERKSLEAEAEAEAEAVAEAEAEAEDVNENNNDNNDADDDEKQSTLPTTTATTTPSQIPQRLSEQQEEAEVPVAVQNWFRMYYPIVGGFALSILLFRYTGYFQSFVIVPAFLTAKVVQIALRFILPAVDEIDITKIYDHALLMQVRLEKLTHTAKENEKEEDEKKEKDFMTVVAGAGNKMNPFHNEKKGTHEKEA